MNEKKRIKYLIFFIATILALSIGLTIIYTILFDSNNEINAPLDLNVSVDDLSEDSHDEKFRVSDFKILYIEGVDKWQLQIFVENITDNDINIENDYQFVIYDKENTIIKMINGNLKGIIRAHDNILVGSVLDFDGSLINKVEIKAIS